MGGVGQTHMKYGSIFGIEARVLGMAQTDRGMQELREYNWRRSQRTYSETECEGEWTRLSGSDSGKTLLKVMFSGR